MSHVGLSGSRNQDAMVEARGKQMMMPATRRQLSGMIYPRT